MKKIEMVEEGVYKIPLVLPVSLESQRDKLEKTLLSAQKRLKAFAVKNGWESLIKESFADRVEIYDSQDKFIQSVVKTTNSDAAMFPKGFSACLEKRIFMSVSPEVYKQIYPEGIEDKSFEKLIAHEMAHILHIRILNGNEDAMGPVWFFEGFAMHAADQFANSKLELTHDEIWKIIQSPQRRSYESYLIVFKYFLKKTSIQELVMRAQGEDFIDWLRQIERKSNI